MLKKSITNYRLFHFLFLFVCFSTNSQNFEKKTIYIICRGTLSKKELIGERFNISNNNITHLGIGILEDNELKIYNVSDSKIVNNSSLICETLEEFSNINDIFYLGVWEFKTNNSTINKIKNNISELKNIKFDKNFNIANDNELYCSEFVVKVLNSLDYFDFKPSIKKLSGIEKDLLSSDFLEYYPVDFFLQDNRFSLTKIILNNY